MEWTSLAIVVSWRLHVSRNFFSGRGKPKVDARTAKQKETSSIHVATKNKKSLTSRT